MLDFNKLIPSRLKNTTWAYLFQSFIAFLEEEVKTNYIDKKYLTNYDIFTLTIDDIKDILYKYGDSYREFTGYTSTLEYFLRRFFTLNTRIQYRKLPLGFKEIFFIYGLTGESYPMLLTGGYLSSWEEYYLTPEVFTAGVQLDTGWKLDTGLKLDAAEIYNQITNHISLEYYYNYIEKSGYFTTQETFNALVYDILIQKKTTEIPHFEINLDIYSDITKGIGDPLLTTYYNVDKSISSDQSTYYNSGALNNYSKVRLSYNGTGDQDFVIASTFEVVEDSTVGSVQILKLKQLVQYNTSINTFNEITLLDGSDTIIVKATIPIVELPNLALTSTQLNFYLS